MSGYKTVAVAGSGNIGNFIIEELLKAGATVTVLSRKPDTEVPQGASVKAVDYNNADQLAEALSGQDVVVSTLSQGGFAVQGALADASKKAGVKLFVPSEFGNNNDGEFKGLIAGKIQLIDHLKAIGIPYLRVYTGPFADWIWNPYVGFDFANGKATIVGKGDNPISFTSRRDIGRFVAHALTQFPTEKLANQTLRIEGDRKTFNEVFDLVEKKSGKKLEVTRRDLEFVRKEVTEKAFAPETIIEQLFLAWNDGYGFVGEPLATYPGWNPAKVEDFLSA